MENKIIGGTVNLLLLTALVLIVFYSKQSNPSEYIAASVALMVVITNMNSESKSYIAHLSSIVGESIKQFKYITPMLYMGAYAFITF